MSGLVKFFRPWLFFPTTEEENIETSSTTTRRCSLSRGESTNDNDNDNNNDNDNQDTNENENDSHKVTTKEYQMSLLDVSISNSIIPNSRIKNNTSSSISSISSTRRRNNNNGNGNHDDNDEVHEVQQQQQQQQRQRVVQVLNINVQNQIIHSFISNLHSHLSFSSSTSRSSRTSMSATTNNKFTITGTTGRSIGSHNNNEEDGNKRLSTKILKQYMLHEITTFLNSRLNDYESDDEQNYCNNNDYDNDDCIEKEMTKVLGRYYYDSDCIVDNDDNECDHDENYNVNDKNHDHDSIEQHTPNTTNTTTSRYSTTSIQNHDEIMEESQLQLETQPPLMMLGLGLGLGLHHHTGINTATGTLHTPQSSSKSTNHNNNTTTSTSSSSSYQPNNPTTPTKKRKRNHDKYHHPHPTNQHTYHHVQPNLFPIPPISKTNQHVTNIHNIHLHSTQTLSIPMASIRILWEGSKIQQLHTLKDVKDLWMNCVDSSFHDNDNNNNNNNDDDDDETKNMMYPYYIHQMEELKHELLQSHCETYGPLHQNYKTVLCMELLELDEESVITIHNNNNNNNNCMQEYDEDDEINNDDDENVEDILTKRNTKIRSTINAAFQLHPDRHDDTTTKSTTTNDTNNGIVKEKRRRIRVFFYNDYVRNIRHFLETLKGQLEDANTTTTSSSYSSSSSKMITDMTQSNHPYLVSLRNIPAKCIFPYKIGRTERATEALLEKKFGRLSPYCICIGGQGIICNRENREPHLFQSDESEVRILPLRSSSAGGGAGEKREEFVINGISHRYLIDALSHDQNCVMLDQFVSLMKVYKEKLSKQVKRKQNEGVGKRKGDRSVSTSGSVQTLTMSSTKKGVKFNDHIYSMLVSKQYTFLFLFVCKLVYSSYFH